MPHLLEAVRAVDGGGLVQFLVYAGDCGHVHDGRPAKALPGAVAPLGDPHALAGGHKIDGVADEADAFKKVVHKAVQRQKRMHHRVHDDPAYEIWHGGQDLHGLSVAHKADLA